MNLTDRERQQARAMIDRREPLPSKYKLMEPFGGDTWRKRTAGREE
jgi:hypothetical protein